MKYEIVTLEEKIIVGVSVETSNTDPKMFEKIGKLWFNLYDGGIHTTIKNKVNGYGIGLYSDYTENTYLVTAGNEVSRSENSELTTKIIPAGNYAKFTLYGNLHTEVGKAWGEIWNMDLDRSFTGDFEEYLNNDPEHAQIHIYIGLK